MVLSTQELLQVEGSTWAPVKCPCRTTTTFQVSKTINEKKRKAFNCLELA